MTRAEFADALYRYASHFHASVTSYGRTVDHNTAVGGHPHSKHLTWLAADVVYDDKPALADRRVYAMTLGIAVVPESDHDHLQEPRRVPQEHA